MRNAVYFIAGILFVTLISATTVSIMTVKPAIPKATIVKYFDNDYDFVEELPKFIKQKIKEGYIVKTVSISSRRYERNAIVVLEKY